MPTKAPPNRQSVIKAQNKFSDAEIQAHLDEMSQRHMEASTGLEYIIEWLFRHQDKLPDGTTKEQVKLMTQFRKIELLERLADVSVSLGNTQVPRREICQFVEEVDKEGFRTADDLH
jgi:hypothetical protein